ncbi:hypothetical protein ABK040_003438 [Willaertia magna]
MINLEELQKAKLNKIEKPIEKSSFSFKNSLSSNWYSEEKEKLANYRENQILAQLDQWMPFIPKEITFNTVFIDIQRECALKLIKIHDEFIIKTKKLLNLSNVEEKENQEKEIVESLKTELKKDENIQHLVKQIDECSLWNNASDNSSTIAMNINNSSTIIKNREPLFFKLSSRSPKDVIKLNGKDLMSLFQKDLQEHFPLAQNDNSNRIISFTRAATELMKISSSDEVVELMLRSTRVNTDLIETYQDFWNEKSLDNNNSSLNKIALREWDSTIDIRLEFRTFIVCGKLKAISQYNHVIYVEEIEKYNEKIKDLIKKSVKYIKENLDKQKDLIFKHFVADFVIYPKFFTDIENDKVDEKFIYNGEYIKLIELNPYEESTGACMFSWKDDKEIIPMPPPLQIIEDTVIIEEKNVDDDGIAFRFITREFKENYLEKHLNKVVAPEYKFLLV